jgi:chromosome segregation ATPase
LAELRERLGAESAEAERCWTELNESLRDSEGNYAKIVQSHEMARSEVSRLTGEAVVLRTDLEAARRCVEDISTLVVVYLAILNVEERARADRAETLEAAYRAADCDRDRLSVALAEARESLAGTVSGAEEERRCRELLETKVGDLQRMADAMAMDLGAAEDRAQRNSREMERVRKLATLLATERDQLAAERDRLLDLHQQHLAQIGVAIAPARDLSRDTDSTVGIRITHSAAPSKETIATVDHLINQWSADGFRRFRSRRRHQ